ncbi:hypothetical protein [Ornithinimicrobium sufpigmenti]|uniref:hypothetical protein n=1 Tax=Ornithinimicrobium sufpigmenti TaxID=2508882 RepID=UPI0015E1B5C1|nr:MULTISPECIES: hypothetical protein [unclassified Ornithinimicrobium]
MTNTITPAAPATWSPAYEFAALSGAACAVLGLGAGMYFNRPGIGAVLGAGAGLVVRAAAVTQRHRFGK